MRSNTKKEIRLIRKGIVIVSFMLLFGAVSVCAVNYFSSNAVTYDNTESGLSSTNVQSAIDELYTECTEVMGGASILDKVKPVTSGDGLYEDEYESGRYFYKGINPNNYITFNNENAGWRIISIEADGTIKIIRNEYLPNQKVFDSVGRRTLEYCHRSDSGCHVWAKMDYFTDETILEWTNAGTVDTDSELNIYLNTDYYSSLIKTNQSQIVNHRYNIGTAFSLVMEGNYDNESALLKVINGESTYSWKGKIGLISLSEYLRTNANMDQCSQPYDGTYINSSFCFSSNWVTNGDKHETWMITPRVAYSDMIYVIGVNFINDGFSPGNQYYVRPVLYLSSDVKLSGTGTQSDPYKVE